MSFAYELLYSRVAYEDLRSVGEYMTFQLKMPDIAKRQIGRIQKAVRKLERYPKRNPHAEWEPWESMGVRRMVVDNYLVFYRVVDETARVEVIRILYGGRDIREIAGRGFPGDFDIEEDIVQGNGV